MYGAQRAHAGGVWYHHTLPDDVGSQRPFQHGEHHIKRRRRVFWGGRRRLRLGDALVAPEPSLAGWVVITPPPPPGWRSFWMSIDVATGHERRLMPVHGRPAPHR